ncbi:hypothetical protein ElyMa_001122300 [Elysia marginata]|uniref:Uncharacterized protein n=1 Tax=Elysia marginata TaxID=1093978 RepID=A0AAV4HYA5_9GAST|nr:hypothetical protein ElyMa_001122300 [Elysia marginata]
MLNSTHKFRLQRTSYSQILRLFYSAFPIPPRHPTDFHQNRHCWGRKHIRCLADRFRIWHYQSSWRNISSLGCPWLHPLLSSGGFSHHGHFSVTSKGTWDCR